VVHLDIKLENVMISSRGDVKLMDFGLARAISDASEEKVVTGTPLYMAPEQIAGGAVDHRTDIYAFGVMLYLLCAGKWPVGRDTALHDHLYESPADPRSLNPELSDEAAKVILKCLSKTRRGRYDRIEDVGTSLLAAMQPTPQV
jgi:serine/threonine-protein kinase